MMMMIGGGTEKKKDNTEKQKTIEKEKNQVKKLYIKRWRMLKHISINVRIMADAGMT